jgi:hypothetical protein
MTVLKPHCAIFVRSSSKTTAVASRAISYLTARVSDTGGKSREVTVSKIPANMIAGKYSVEGDDVVIGKDIAGPLACIRRVKPEIAACNAGSLNYLKIKDNGRWAWPPMVFDNPVAKVQQYLDVMAECGVHPEFECFDVGIVRAVASGRRDKHGNLVEHELLAPAEFLASLVGDRAPRSSSWVAGGLYRLVRNEFLWEDAPTVEIEGAAERQLPRAMRINRLMRPLSLFSGGLECGAQG